MYNIFCALAALMLLLPSPGRAAEEGFRGSHSGFGMFYSSLSPYGVWIEIDDGLIAWQPTGVHRRWQPYAEGRWVYSRYGWYWDSYEPFGWAVYHYGRWYRDDYYGWLWLPDDQWAPAWVEWRYDDDYIGWAPLPPFAVFNIRIGIQFTREYHYPSACWHYVRFNDFHRHDVYRYYVPEKYKFRIHGRTKYRNNYGYDGEVVNRGVDRNFIERRSGRRIEERDIVMQSRQNKSDRSDDRRISVYRPEDNGRQRGRDVSDMKIKRGERRTGLSQNEVKLRQNYDRSAADRQNADRKNADRQNADRQNAGGNDRRSIERGNTERMNPDRRSTEEAGQSKARQGEERQLNPRMPEGRPFSRKPEERGNDGHGNDGRINDNRANENRVNESRGSENRVNESRGSDNRVKERSSSSVQPSGQTESVRERKRGSENTSNSRNQGSRNDGSGNDGGNGRRR